MRIRNPYARIAIAIIAVVFIIVIGGGYLMMNNSVNSDTTQISENIHIGTVDVGGMSTKEATAKVEDYVADLMNKDVVLTAGKHSVTVKAKDLGLAWSNREVISEAGEYGKTGSFFARAKVTRELKNEKKEFKLALASDPDKVSAVLKEHEKELSKKAVDYKLKRKDGEFSVKGGEEGWTVDETSAAMAINTYFQYGWVDNPNIELTVTTIEPQGSGEMLAKVKDRLGTFSTSYGSSASGRKANIRNGCKKINGTLLYPGESFSVYNACSPFTEENGYEIAKAYENGTTVDSVGGGICQVSTTLYNAVIRAELQVDERHGHSMVVNYVKPSCDAAIAGTDKDFKFTNSLEYPIYIAGAADGDTITFSIYGCEMRPENREIEFESEVTSTTEPKNQIRATGARIGSVHQVQSAHTGYSAKLWKIIKIDGSVESKEEFNHTTYNMSPNVFEVGTSSDIPEATSEVRAAIDSGSMSKVYAAISKWEGAKKEDTEKEEAAKEEKDDDSVDELSEEEAEQDPEDEGGADDEV